MEKYRTERNETRGRHTEEVECEGEKNSNVHSAVHVVYVHSFVFFYSHLLYPTLTQATREVSFQGLAAWLFVPAAQTQFAFRPLSFLHDTLLLRPSLLVVYVSSRFPLFFGFKRIFSNFFPLEISYSTLDEYRWYVVYREKRMKRKSLDSITNHSKLWKNNFSRTFSFFSNTLRSLARDP